MRNLGFFLLLMLGQLGRGQTITVTEHEVPTKPDRLELDGAMAVGEWTGALSLPLSWEINPGYNSPAPLATEGYVFRDGEALYVAFRCSVDPKDFRANLNRRDAAWEDDFVGIALDVYGDTRNMVFLGSNAYGVQLDVRKNDPANHMDDQMDVSYDVEFTTQAARQTDYYTVEMRIPFNTLQFGSSKRQRNQYGGPHVDSHFCVLFSRQN
ncbi:MAG: sugar-binding protein [Schleiferiaceae bacterium]